METTFNVSPGLKQRFAETWFHPLHLARRSLRAALVSAAPQARGYLLDVGCGGQRYRSLFAHAKRYVGVDLPSNSANTSLLSAFASGLNLPFADRSFDTVLCTEVLEHVPEPLVMMQEIARVLRSGGCLILTTPQTWGLHEAPHDYYRYTEFGLRYLAERSGLTVERVQPTCGIWATVGQRLSSFIFFTFGDGRPLLVKAFLALMCAGWQITMAGLDALFSHRGDPLDHLLVARK
jgi:SAM-dependent methyltransferase